MLAITLGVLASVVLSAASLEVAIQARNQSEPSLSYQFPRSLAVRAEQCADSNQTDAQMMQFDFEYVVTVTNSGGRATNLLHATVTSGANGALPWPLALTDGPTAFGSIIDGGQATFVLPPAPISSGLSKKIVVNGRIRVNASDASQKATAAAIGADSNLRLQLIFSSGGSRSVTVPYTVQHAAATDTPAPCDNAGDFHYQVDQV
jgi:hypothetical protein